MPPQPWRDVCSVELWTSTTNSYKAGRGSRSLNGFIDATTSALRAYHAVEKADLTLFTVRRGNLKTIAGNIERYLSQGEGQRAPDGFKILVALLQHQAKLKAEYLTKIKDFYGGGEGNQFLDPVQFINFLRAPHVPPASGARLQPGARMEALDPAHRPFEMHFQSDGSINWADLAGLMQLAFAEWIGAIRKPIDGEAELVNKRALNDIDPTRNNALNTPFFVWLENHQICVGQDEQIYHDDLGQNFRTREVGQVIYSPYRSGVKPLGAVDEIHWLMPSTNGLVKEFLFNANGRGDFRTFDTQHLSGKGDQPNSAAYVWTTCGTLLTGVHKENHLHHSTFVGGTDVTCAGMINVNRGKVEMISNNSGHYRPSVGNLRDFAKWLNERNVFKANSQAFISSADGTTKMAMADFLGGQVQIMPISGNRIGTSLNMLATSMNTVVQKYSVSSTKGGLFGYTSIFRNKSEESQKVLDYLKTDFPKDIETAKLDRDNPSWYSFPNEVIKTLLGEPGSLPFNKLLEQVSGRTVIGNRNFSSLAGLKPLNKSSTMHAILSEEYAKWYGF